MKQLSQPIFYLQWVLVSFSTIAFGLATLEGFKMSFDPSSDGFKNYLALFNPFSFLFTATFVVITAHLAIERLGLMSDANNTTFKASNRTVWLQIVREFLPELKDENQYMYKEFTKQLLIVHDYLFDKKYKISNENETREFFDKFFKTRVEFFETLNGEFQSITCYKNESQSYTWIAFRYIIVIMMNNVDECYPNFISDLKKLYQQQILEFNKNCIDPHTYELKKRDYIMRKIRQSRSKIENSSE